MIAKYAQETKAGIDRVIYGTRSMTDILHPFPRWSRKTIEE